MFQTHLDVPSIFIYMILLIDLRSHLLLIGTSFKTLVGCSNHTGLNYPIMLGLQSTIMRILGKPIRIMSYTGPENAGNPNRN